MKKELNSRANINFLVRTFYNKVRKDDFIGPIFNNSIDDWEGHFETLTDFWESNILFVRSYKGNPVKTHRAVDSENNYSINSEHFGRWLHLWYSTIDEHFIGDHAQIAKNRARNMSTFLFIKMFEAREKEQID